MKKYVLTIYYCMYHDGTEDQMNEAVEIHSDNVEELLQYYNMYDEKEVEDESLSIDGSYLMLSMVLGCIDVETDEEEWCRCKYHLIDFKNMFKDFFNIMNEARKNPKAKYFIDNEFM